MISSGSRTRRSRFKRFLYANGPHPRGMPAHAYGGPVLPLGAEVVEGSREPECGGTRALRSLSSAWARWRRGPLRCTRTNGLRDGVLTGRVRSTHHTHHGPQPPCLLSLLLCPLYDPHAALIVHRLYSSTDQSSFATIDHWIPLARLPSSQPLLLLFVSTQFKVPALAIQKRFERNLGTTLNSIAVVSVRDIPLFTSASAFG